MEVVVGRIGRPQGLLGLVTVEVRTDDPGLRFAVGTSLVTEPSGRGPLVVLDVREHSGRLLLAFAGVHDRSAAESLRDTLLLAEVDPAQTPEEPDSFYDHQLVGLQAVTLSGAVVGEVVDVLHLPGQDVLSLHRPDGGEVLVPFVAAIVPEVDLPGGRVVLDPPVGLLEELEEPEAP